MNLDYIHAFVVMKPKGSKKGNQFGHLSHTTKSSQAGKGPTEKNLIQYPCMIVDPPTMGSSSLSVLITYFPNWSGEPEYCLPFLSRSHSLCGDYGFTSRVFKPVSEPGNGQISTTWMGVGARRGWNNPPSQYRLANYPKYKRWSLVFASSSTVLSTCPMPST